MLQGKTLASVHAFVVGSLRGSGVSLASIPEEPSCTAGFLGLSVGCSWTGLGWKTFLSTAFPSALCNLRAVVTVTKMVD